LVGCGISFEREVVVAIQVVGSSAHVTVQYEDSKPNAKRRAEAVLRSCERDLMRLEKDYFRVKGYFEAPQPPLLVTVSTAGIASNNGFDPHRQSTITIDSFSALSDQDLADSIAQMLFVAEASEVLMGVLNYFLEPHPLDPNDPERSQARWHPFWSDGEGLSRVLSAEFYPDAYYSWRINGPFADSWLNDPSRANPATAAQWVTRNEHTDVNQVSFGCATLFVYYLHSQLGYDWDEICANARSTLAATYTILTGKADAATAFTQLLNTHFPPGTSNTLASENPFPLWDAPSRQVWIDDSESRIGLSPIAAEGIATTSPFIGCPADSYGYTIFNDTVDLRCVARTYGFGQPSFNWKVNGADAGGGAGILLAQAANIGVDEPDHPGQRSVHSQDETLSYWTSDASTYQGPAGQLTLRNLTSPGHIAVTVEVEVTEAADPAVARAARTVVLDTQRTVYEQRFYDDRDTCQKRLRDRLFRYVKVRDILNLLLTLPDPPHDLVNAAAQFNRISHELTALREHDPELAAGVTEALKTLGLHPGAF
jgi:hypothetical protein